MLIRLYIVCPCAAITRRTLLPFLKEDPSSAHLNQVFETKYSLSPDLNSSFSNETSESIFISPKTSSKGSLTRFLAFFLHGSSSSSSFTSPDVTSSLCVMMTSGLTANVVDESAVDEEG